MLLPISLLSAIVSVLRVSLADLQVILPPILSELTPDCAAACVAAFIQDELSNCNDANDLNCLCESQSSNGYTLGEGGLACIASECPISYLSSSSSLYEICSYDENAASMTHGTLTASMAIPTTILFDTDSTTFTTTTTTSFSSSTPFAVSNPFSITSSSIATGISSSISSPSMSSASMSSASMSSSSMSSPSGLVLETSYQPSLTTFATTSMVPSTSASLTQVPVVAATTGVVATPVLAPGQIAGIAVAGTAMGAITVGILLCIFCGKKFKKDKEKEKKRDSDASFGGSRVYPSDPDLAHAQLGSGQAAKPVTPSMPAPTRSEQAGPKANQFLGLPVVPNQHRSSWWKKFGHADRPQTPKASNDGVARHLTPFIGGVSQEPSPTSIASYRTTSRLLPEKPSYQPSSREAFGDQISIDIQRTALTNVAGHSNLPIVSSDIQDQQGLLHPAYRPSPPTLTSQPAMQKQPSMEGSALKGKLSDPFLNRPDEAASNTNMFSRNRASRSFLPRLDTLKPADARSTLPSQSRGLQPGLPNFRSLVQAQQSKQQISPRQLPSVVAVPPMAPDLVVISAPEEPVGAAQDSVLNQGRASRSPFFSSQPSQYTEYRPGRARSKRVRPETHYTTSSDTEFEDDDQSPISPPEQHGGIAELSGLSPVAESPASRATREGGVKRTPSPRAQGSPLEPDDRGTPLSEIRYPQVPGKEASPKREVTSVPVTIGIPHEAQAVHVGQLMQTRPSFSPLRQNITQDSKSSGSSISVSPLYTPASKVYETKQLRLQAQTEQSKPGAKLIPSPLRPARHTNENSQSPALERAPVPANPESSHPSTSLSASTKRFLETASHAVPILSATDHSLGNWPLQPVRPVRPAASQSPSAVTSTQTGDTTKVGHLRRMSGSAPPNQGLQGLRSNKADNTGRGLLVGPSGRIVHGPALRSEMPSRKALPPLPAAAQAAAQAPAQAPASGFVTSSSTAALDIGSGREVAHERDMRREMQRIREWERRRADPRLGTAPPLPPKSGDTPRSVQKGWGVGEAQARRELLGRGTGV